MKLFSVLFFTAFLVSCSGGSDKGSATIVEVIGDKEESCVLPTEALLWKTFYVLDEEQLLLPSLVGGFDQGLQKILEERFPDWSLSENNSAKVKFVESYNSLLSQLAQLQVEKSSSFWPKVLAQIELGIVDDEVTKDERDQLQAHLEKASLAFEQLPLDCSGDGARAPRSPVKTAPNDEFGTGQGEPSASSFIGKLKRSHHPIVYGAKKVFLTAYQDCRIDDRVEAFHRRTAEVQGVLRLSSGHENGIGGKRVIKDPDQLYSSHHYYGFRSGGGRTLASLESGEYQCLNQRNFLMIYDYGGKPATYARRNSSLNMFRHAVDSASPDLGMDCSGFVFSALASAGLKLHPNKEMIAKQVYAVGAENFRQASPSVMPCLKKFDLNSSRQIKNGDIISTPTHTLIVDRVGADPLAIRKHRWQNSCSEITYQDFDFEVLQSNGSKGGIGIHRMRGDEHLRTSKSMRLPLEALARASCEAARKGKSHSSALNLKSGGHKVSIIRHTNSKECRGREISLTAESCLNECGG